MPAVQNCTKRRCRRRLKALDRIHTIRLLCAYGVARAREQLQAGRIDLNAATIQDICNRIDLRYATARRDRIFRLLQSSCSPCYLGLNI